MSFLSSAVAHWSWQLLVDTCAYWWNFASVEVRLRMYCVCSYTNMIHVWNIIYMYLHFPVIYHKHQPNVGEYIPCMDPMGDFYCYNNKQWNLSTSPFGNSSLFDCPKRDSTRIPQGAAPTSTSCKWGYNSYNWGYNLSYPSIGHLQGLFHSIHNW